MKDILIAIDGSGSIVLENMRIAVAKTLSTVCPDSNIQFCQFTHDNIIELDIDLFFKYDHILYGAGANVELVYAIEDDFDHIFLITDGYVDNLQETETVNVVIYDSIKENV